MRDVPTMIGEGFAYLVVIGVFGSLAFSLLHQMT
jgi:hypothetical protein